LDGHGVALTALNKKAWLRLPALVSLTAWMNC
jgi:hypothetical protein